MLMVVVVVEGVKMITTSWQLTIEAIHVYAELRVIMHCTVFLEFTKKNSSFAVAEAYGLSQSCSGWDKKLNGAE